MKKGFTLLEVVLVIVLIGILAGILLPLYMGFANRNNLDIAVAGITQGLRRAQLISQAVNNDSTWGIKVQGSSIVLFKGTDFATRDQTYDESFYLEQNVTPSGLTEVVFSKFYGLPLATGTITITSATGEARSIVINAKGTLQY